MKFIRLVFLVAICFVCACNPAGKFVKRGNLKLDANLYEEASVYYYNALLNSPNNIKAKEGLSTSAQKVLNDKFIRFNELVVANNISEAIEVYQNAKRYSETSQSVGVPLQWPSEYQEVYLDIRTEYIAKLYDDALLMMNNKQYEQAEQVFERIALLDTTYSGITVLRINTVLEPLYQHGIIELNQAKYKQAFQTFSKIVLQDENYKDAKKLKEEANNKATKNIAVFPISFLQKNEHFIAIDLASLIDKKLEQKNLAYLKIESSNDVRKILENRGWTDVSSTDKAIEAGNNLGLKYIILVVVENVSYTETPIISEQKTAYEAFSENILNPYTGTYAAITKFRKVTYEDLNEQRALSVTLTYHLISVADKKVMLSDQIKHIQKDEVHQFVYTGNINNVYDQLPNSNALPPINEQWRDLFTNTRRLPLTELQLANEVNFLLTSEISKSVLSYLK